MSNLKEKLSQVRGVELYTTPMYNSITGGIQTNCRILFQILGGTDPNMRRRSINLCIVLDNSGSMFGQKLDFCKKAIKDIIGLLKAGDKLHIITYNEKVNNVYSNFKPTESIIEKATILNRVDAITANGSTDLLLGTQAGIELLNDNGSDEKVKVIFLFSDGLTNRGTTDAELIGSTIKQQCENQNISISTFGIGDDFDEKLLSSIARCGNGNYFYIDDLETVPSLVTKALDGFTNIIAKDLRIQVRGAPDCMLIQLGDCQNIQDGQYYPILRECGFYQFMCEVQVNQINKENFSFVNLMPVIYYQMTYTTVDSTPQTKTITGSVELVVHDDFISKEPNAAVVCYDTMMNAGKLCDRVSNYLKQRDIAKAIKLKKQIIEMYAQVLNIDEYGFINALKKKEEESLSVLEREGISKKSTKSCMYTSTFTPGSKAKKYSYENDTVNDRDLSFTLV